MRRFISRPPVQARRKSEGSDILKLLLDHPRVEVAYPIQARSNRAPRSGKAQLCHTLCVMLPSD
jgi:hypothetical protein